MRALTEKDQRRLMVLCKGGQWFGWFLVFMSVVMAGTAVWSSQHLIEMIGVGGFISTFVGAGSRILFMGLILLLLIHLIRYLFDQDCTPGFLLKKGHFVLYLFALCLMLEKVGDVIGLYSGDLDETLYISGVLVTGFFLLTKVVVLTGLGFILQLILPVIRESKTLV